MLGSTGGIPMETCINCGWASAAELIRGGLCLACSEYRWRTGRDRPPPDDLAQLHRGETWPGAVDPRVRALVSRAGGER
jgi:hypothetical protein